MNVAKFLKLYSKDEIIDMKLQRFATLVGCDVVEKKRVQQLRKEFGDNWLPEIFKKIHNEHHVCLWRNLQFVLFSE